MSLFRPDNKRTTMLSAAVFLGFAVICVRLGDLMLLTDERLAHAADAQHHRTEVIQVNRGRIVDRRGRELAVNLDCVTITANPKLVEDPEATARVLAEHTGEKYSVLLSRLKSDRGFVWIKRKMGIEEAEPLRAMRLAGVNFVPDSRRYYPKGRLASHVIGFTGIDNQALEGVELAYDGVLHGGEVDVVVSRDARGNRLGGGLESIPRGNTVVLTIDETLQYLAERSLASAMAQWKAASGSVIMMDPSNGEILALANWPAFDLNEVSSSGMEERRNRAITDPYEPGSTFKLVTATAALEEGVIRPGMTFDASSGFIRVGKMTVWDTSNKGVLSFGEVIKTSSNVGAIMIGRLIDGQRYYGYVRGYGFGSRTGIDLGGENTGRVPELNRWSETTHAALSIGYEVAATPLQVLRAYAAIANGGRLVRPHVVGQVLDHEGLPIYQFGEVPEDSPARVASARTTRTLSHILESVTEEGGTATMASLRGNRVAGKTGTTRLIDPETGEYSTRSYASTFVGFVPADDPRIAMIVVIYDPKGKYYGGLVSAPVFSEVAAQALAYLNVPLGTSGGSNVLMVKRSDMGRTGGGL